MKKLNSFTFIATLFAINILDFVNASLLSQPLDFSNLIEGFNPETIGLLIIALISFLILYRGVFSKFKSGGMWSFIGAFLILWGVSYSGLDVSNLMGFLGWEFGSTGFMIISIIALIGVIYAIKKVGVDNLFFILGGIAIIFSFTDYVYEKGVTALIGGIFFVIGLLLRRRRKRKEANRPIGLARFGKNAKKVWGGAKWTGKKSWSGAKYSLDKAKASKRWSMIKWYKRQIRKKDAKYHRLYEQARNIRESNPNDPKFGILSRQCQAIQNEILALKAKLNALS